MIVVDGQKTTGDIFIFIPALIIIYPTPQILRLFILRILTPIPLPKGEGNRLSRSMLDCYDEDTEVVADQGEILIILTSTGGVSEGESELDDDSEVGRMGMKPLFI